MQFLNGIDLVVQNDFTRFFNSRNLGILVLKNFLTDKDIDLVFEKINLSVLQDNLEEFRELKANNDVVNMGLDINILNEVIVLLEKNNLKHKIKANGCDNASESKFKI